MDWARQLWMRLQTLFRRDHLTQDLDMRFAFTSMSRLQKISPLE
jgi:hypothetical protein